MTTAPGRPVDAVLFDLFGTLLSLRPLDDVCEGIAPGRGAELAGRWRARQLELSWLRTAMQRWVDFDQVTEDALENVLREMDVAAEPAAVARTARGVPGSARPSGGPRRARSPARRRAPNRDPDERVRGDARCRAAADRPDRRSRPVGRRRTSVQATSRGVRARDEGDRPAGRPHRLRHGQRLGRCRGGHVRVPGRVAARAGSPPAFRRSARRSRSRRPGKTSPRSSWSNRPPDSPRCTSADWRPGANICAGDPHRLIRRAIGRDSARLCSGRTATRPPAGHDAIVWQNLARRADSCDTAPHSTSIPRGRYDQRTGLERCVMEEYMDAVAWRRGRLSIVLLAVAAIAVGACTSSGAASSSAPEASEPPAASEPLRPAKRRQRGARQRGARVADPRRPARQGPAGGHDQDVHRPAVPAPVRAHRRTASTRASTSTSGPRSRSASAWRSPSRPRAGTSSRPARGAGAGTSASAR